MSTTKYRALKAKDAGVLLAELLGLSEPVSEQSMWKLARHKEIPHKRLAGQVFFRTDWLERFVSEDDSGLFHNAIDIANRENTKDQESDTAGSGQGPTTKRSAP